MIRRAHEFDLATDNGPACHSAATDGKCGGTVYTYTLDRPSNTFRADCVACGWHCAISYGPTEPRTAIDARRLHENAHGILYGDPWTVCEHLAIAVLCGECIARDMRAIEGAA